MRDRIADAGPGGKPDLVTLPLRRAAVDAARHVAFVLLGKLEAVLMWEKGQAISVHSTGGKMDVSYYRLEQETGSRLKLLLLTWERGKAIHPEVTGVNSGAPKTYYALMKETGQNEKSLKKWYHLFLKYPEREKYLLTASQRAMIGARARDYYDKRAKERQLANLKRGGEKPVVETLPQREDSGKSRDQAGRATHVSGRYVEAPAVFLWLQESPGRDRPAVAIRPARTCRP